jgi:hypothetical protein
MRWRHVVVIPASFIAFRRALRQRGFLIVGSPGTETPPSNYVDESAVSDRSLVMSKFCVDENAENPPKTVKTKKRA